MEEKNKAIVGCIVFLILILFIGIGGYIYTFKSDKHENSIIKENTITDEYKKDKNQAYIYYIEEETISDSLGIKYQNPIINLVNSQANAIYNEIKKENDNYKNEIKKISNTENTTGQEIVYNNDDIYSATIRNYEDYEYNNYISLIITDLNYDCFKGPNDTLNIKSYIFDVTSNERISSLDLLSKFDLTLASVKEKITDKLKEEQTIENDEEVIKIDDTIENLNNDNTYALYIDNNGKLVIKYIVKSNQIDYNESMILD